LSLIGLAVSEWFGGQGLPLVSLGRHENHSLERQADLTLCLRLSKG